MFPFLLYILPHLHWLAHTPTGCEEEAGWHLQKAGHSLWSTQSFSGTASSQAVDINWCQSADKLCTFMYIYMVTGCSIYTCSYPLMCCKVSMALLMVSNIILLCSTLKWLVSLWLTCCTHMLALLVVSRPVPRAHTHTQMFRAWTMPLVWLDTIRWCPLATSLRSAVSCLVSRLFCNWGTNWGSRLIWVFHFRDLLYSKVSE